MLLVIPYRAVLFAQSNRFADEGTVRRPEPAKTVLIPLTWDKPISSFAGTCVECCAKLFNSLGIGVGIAVIRNLEEAE